MGDTRARQPDALAELGVLLLAAEGHHVPLKDVASFCSISKVLNVVKDVQLAGHR